MTLRVGSPFVRWFASIGIADRSTAGGKGASLGELDRAGIPVPPGFVVTTAAFERMLGALDANGATRARIARLDAADLPGVKNACADIRQRIENTPLSTELQAMLLEAYRELSGREHDTPVAVRSSATSADSTDATFAGRLDTFLWVRGIEGVAHCVRSCWASLYNVESVCDRLRSKVPEQSVAMGVIVQRMIDAHCSGLMFTRSPTGDRSAITIEASWGLGSAIVSREVIPDRFVVNKVTGDIVNRTVSEKLIQHLPDAIAGGVRREPVPDEWRSIQCLTDGQLSELARTAKRVERHHGSAQAIEWAIAQNERGVHLLQSRPDPGTTNRDPDLPVTPRAKSLDPVVSLLGERQR